MSSAPVAFVCPRCRGALIVLPSAYRCELCHRDYPVLFGIPDFRLRSDRYLTLEEERWKAGRVHEFAITHDLRETVAFYYSITHDLPPELVSRYQAGILAAPARASVILDDLKLSSGDRLFDVGCGTGGLLVAAKNQCRVLVGADIALRWLVVCRKRLEESGTDAVLVCADAEALPFADGGFTQAVAADLIDHVYDPAATLREIRRQLPPGGRLWLSATNRYCIGPHPMTGVWATGYLPRGLRVRLLTRLKGIDLLRYANLLSPGEVDRLLGQAGFSIVRQGPKRLPARGLEDYSPSIVRAMKSYRFLLRFRLLRYLLLKVGPAFEVVACREAA